MATRPEIWTTAAEHQTLNEAIGAFCGNILSTSANHSDRFMMSRCEGSFKEEYQ